MDTFLPASKFFFRGEMCLLERRVYPLLNYFSIYLTPRSIFNPFFALFLLLVIICLKLKMVWKNQSILTWRLKKLPSTPCWRSIDGKRPGVECHPPGSTSRRWVETGSGSCKQPSPVLKFRTRMTLDALWSHISSLYGFLNLPNILFSKNGFLQTRSFYISPKRISQLLDNFWFCLEGWFRPEGFDGGRVNGNLVHDLF